VFSPENPLYITTKQQVIIACRPYGRIKTRLTAAQSCSAAGPAAGFIKPGSYKKYFEVYKEMQ